MSSNEHDFPPAPPSVRPRAYRPAEVDAFLDRLGEEYALARARVEALEAEAGRLGAEAEALREAVAALPPADYAVLGGGAVDLLGLVEEEAEELAATARAEADALDERARAEAVRLAAAAHEAATAVRTGADA
ncbi:DivIVA domain-containing protein, partial [Streptomyces sp. TverLS-915]